MAKSKVKKEDRKAAKAQLNKLIERTAAGIGKVIKLLEQLQAEQYAIQQQMLALETKQTALQEEHQRLRDAFDVAQREQELFIEMQQAAPAVTPPTSGPGIGVVMVVPDAAVSDVMSLLHKLGVIPQTTPPIKEVGDFHEQEPAAVCGSVASA